MEGTIGGGGSKGEWKGVEEGGRVTHVRHVHVVNNAALRASLRF